MKAPKGFRVVEPGPPSQHCVAHLVCQYGADGAQVVADLLHLERDPR